MGLAAEEVHFELRQALLAERDGKEDLELPGMKVSYTYSHPRFF